MAWTAMPTFVAGPLTAAQLNVLVANLNETAPAKATTAGRHFVSTGTNSVAERAIETAIVATSQNTSSTSYTDLTTTGPAVTVTTGTRAIVIVSSRLENSTGTAQSFVSHAVSGATTLAADDAWSLWFQSDSASQKARMSTVHMHTGLTGGSNTFTAKYRVGSGMASFQERSIVVIAL